MKSFVAAKQRLSESLGAGSRQALAQAMFTDVIWTLRHVPELDEIAVVTADATAEAAARGERVTLLRDTAQAGQSQAALIGIAYALAEGYDRAVLVPGDTPLLDQEEVSALLQSSADGVTIVPDRHGSGTNALVLWPPGALEPAFGPDSRARHVANAEAAGVPHRVEVVPTLALDVDTGGDLAELTAELALRRGCAPSTRGVLQQLDRAGAWTAPAAQAPA